jgi:hypothetical protein
MMFFLPLLALLAYDPTTYPLNNNEWSFPLMEIIHIAGFALSIGTICVVDMRLLGVGIFHEAPSQALKDTATWSLAGLLLVPITGFAIFFSDPVMYLHNQSFRFKVTVLTIAIVYNYTIRRWAARTGPSGATAASIGGAILLLGGLALAIWDMHGGFGVAGVAAIIAGGLALALYPSMRKSPEGSWGTAHALIGAVSVLLWVSVVFGGLFIAFV